MRQIYKIELARSFQNTGFKISLLIGCGIACVHWITCVIPIAFYQDTYMTSDILMRYPSNVFNNWIGASTYMYSYLFFLFIPLLAALAYGSSFLSDMKYGFIQNVCIRTERKHYFLAKYLAVFLSGGISVLIPLGLNFMLTSAVLPLVKPQAADYTSLIGIGSTLGDFFFECPMIYIWIFAIIIFLFSGIYATYALIAAYYTEHLFITVLMPFVLTAFFNSIASIFGKNDWQSVFFLNPGYPGNRLVPIIVELLILGTFSFIVFVIKGSKEDLCG